MPVHQLKFGESDAPDSLKKPGIPGKDQEIPSVGPSALLGKQAEAVGAVATRVGISPQKPDRALDDLLDDLDTPSILARPQEAPEALSLSAEIADDVEPVEVADVGPEEPQAPSEIKPPKRSPLTKSKTPSELAEALVETFGTDWLAWEPETLRAEIKDEMGRSPSREAWEKIQAAKLCLLSSSPWVEWDIFEKVALAFNNIVPNFQVVEDLSPAQVTFAVREMDKLRTDVEFEKDVPYYAAMRIRSGGLILAPSGVEFVDPIMEKMFHSKMGSEDVSFLRDLKEEVRWKMAKYSSTGEAPQMDETEAGIQLARLTAVEEYVKMMGA
jgi:hypothetical protein